MKIRVEYMTQLRMETACATEAFDMPPESAVCELLQAIAERHGERVGALLQGGSREAAVLCFVGTDQVEKHHPLRDGDVVTVMTPISGG
jgi:molybdopterin converting factor small subunit